jgi:hypothetical protein
MRIVFILFIAAASAFSTLYFADFISMAYLNFLGGIGKERKTLLTLSLIMFSVSILILVSIIRRRRQSNDSQ